MLERLCYCALDFISSTECMGCIKVAMEYHQVKPQSPFPHRPKSTPSRNPPDTRLTSPGVDPQSFALNSKFFRIPGTSRHQRSLSDPNSTKRAKSPQLSSQTRPTSPISYPPPILPDSGQFSQFYTLHSGHHLGRQSPHFGQYPVAHLQVSNSYPSQGHSSAQPRTFDTSFQFENFLGTPKAFPDYIQGLAIQSTSCTPFLTYHAPRPKSALNPCIKTRSGKSIDITSTNTKSFKTSQNCQMNYLQIVTHQASKNSPISEYLLLRPFAQNYVSRTGLKVEIEYDFDTNMYICECISNVDPTLAKDFVGIRNVGIVSDEKNFLAIVGFIPLPMTGGRSRRPIHGEKAVPIETFRGWSELVIMESRRRGVFFDDHRSYY